MDLRTNWEKTAELKGQLKGKLEGEIMGERKILKKFIQAHFGDESSEMLEQIEYLTDLSLLEQLTDQLFQNSNRIEAQKLVQEAYDKQRALV